MKNLILITTYNRPELLLRLLMGLNEDPLKNTVHLLIFDDGSTDDYSGTIAYLNKNFKCDYFKSNTNGGKENYWKLIDFAFNELLNYKFNYLIQIPDDVILIENFISKTINSFEAIYDKNKCCLNILNDHSRNGKKVWTKIEPETVYFNNLPYYKIGWVDMCYIANERFFDLLEYSIHKVETMYLQNKKLSSGVGAQISRRIVEAGGTMYQVNKSYVRHGCHVSKMHPEVRKATPLVTNGEKVIASMATIPTRTKALLDVISSILNQVDHLYIYLNNFQETPYFLHHDKITYYHSANELGDLGDAGKFYIKDEIKGYHLTIDDDLIYPKDYVKTIINGIEKFDRENIVSFHGRQFIKKPVKSYYHSAEKKISCLRSLESDSFVDIPGTGVMGYHTDTIKFDIKDFEASNMADIWAAKKAMARNVKIVALKHRSFWIKHSIYVNQRDTIYASLSQHDEFQTKVLNSFI